MGAPTILLYNVLFVCLFCPSFFFFFFFEDLGKQEKKELQTNSDPKCG